MSTIRKGMPSGHDPMGGNRFSLATNAERVCADIMLKMNNNMRNLMLTAALLISGATPAFAASEADFKAAYAAAEAANKEAAGLRNQWTATAATLAAAKKAADSGDFDQAVAQSRNAEALAKASVFQATSEKERWKDLEIR
jgi:hypothetical protein